MGFPSHFLPRTVNIVSNNKHRQRNCCFTAMASESILLTLLYHRAVDWTSVRHVFLLMLTNLCSHNG